MVHTGNGCGGGNEVWFWKLPGLEVRSRGTNGAWGKAAGRLEGDWESTMLRLILMTFGTAHFQGPHLLCPGSQTRTPLISLASPYTRHPVLRTRSWVIDDEWFVQGSTPGTWQAQDGNPYSESEPPRNPIERPGRRQPSQAEAPNSWGLADSFSTHPAVWSQNAIWLIDREHQDCQGCRGLSEYILSQRVPT